MIGRACRAGLVAACLVLHAGVSEAEQKLSGEDLVAVVQLYASGVAEDQSLLIRCPPDDASKTISGWDESLRLLVASLANAGLSADAIADVDRRLASADQPFPLPCDDPVTIRRMQGISYGANWSDLHRTMLTNIGLSVVDIGEASDARIAKVKEVVSTYHHLEALGLQCAAVLQPVILPLLASDWSDQLDSASATLRDSQLSSAQWSPLLDSLRPHKLMTPKGERTDQLKECLGKTEWIDYLSTMRWITFSQDIQKAVAP